jgi:hypothetical protein
VPSVVKAGMVGMVGNKAGNKAGNKGMEGKVGNKVSNAVKFVYSLTWPWTACLLA